MKPSEVIRIYISIKGIATMNPINAKSVQLIELHAFYYLLLLSFIAVYLTSSNIKYIDNQLVTVIKIQMICKCKYKTI